MLIAGINVLQATNRGDMVTDNTFGLRAYPILFVCLLKIHTLRLLAHGREGEAFSCTTTVYVLRSCWPRYQTGVHQVWMLIHRSFCTPNTVVKVKEADLYSAFIEVPYTQGAQVRITQCYRTCLYLVSIH